MNHAKKALNIPPTIDGNVCFRKNLILFSFNYLKNKTELRK